MEEGTAHFLPGASSTLSIARTAGSDLSPRAPLSEAHSRVPQSNARVQTVLCSLLNKAASSVGLEVSVGPYHLLLRTLFFPPVSWTLYHKQPGPAPRYQYCPVMKVLMEVALQKV